MPVIDERVLKPDLVDAAWDLYKQVFTDINRRAAQEHLMPEDHFRKLCADPDMIKFLAYDGDRLVGMSLLTNNLAGIEPRLSLDFWRDRYPSEFARQAVWYVAFVGAQKNQSHAFRSIVLAMYEVVIANHGVVGMDYCTVNVDENRIPEITQMMMSRRDRRTHTTRVDQQSYYVISFPGEDAA